MLLYEKSMNKSLSQCVDASFPFWSSAALMVGGDSRVLAVLKTTTFFRHSKSLNRDQIFRAGIDLGVARGICVYNSSYQAGETICFKSHIKTICGQFTTMYPFHPIF